MFGYIFKSHAVDGLGFCLFCFVLNASLIVVGHNVDGFDFLLLGTNISGDGM